MLNRSEKASEFVNEAKKKLLIKYFQESQERKQTKPHSMFEPE